MISVVNHFDHVIMCTCEMEEDENGRKIVSTKGDGRYLDWRWKRSIKIRRGISRWDWRWESLIK